MPRLRRLQLLHAKNPSLESLVLRKQLFELVLEGVGLLVTVEGVTYLLSQEDDLTLRLLVPLNVVVQLALELTIGALTGRGCRQIFGLPNTYLLVLGSQLVL